MKWRAEIIEYKNESRIAIYFESNKVWNDRIRKLKGARWSSSKKCWHLPDHVENRKRFHLNFANQIKINPIHQQKKEQFSRWLQSKRYSKNTI